VELSERELVRRVSIRWEVVNYIFQLDSPSFASTNPDQDSISLALLFVGSQKKQSRSSQPAQKTASWQRPGNGD